MFSGQNMYSVLNTRNVLKNATTIKQSQTTLHRGFTFDFDAILSKCVSKIKTEPEPKSGKMEPNPTRIP
jgi:hypothetical protein